MKLIHSRLNRAAAVKDHDLDPVGKSGAVGFLTNPATEDLTYNRRYVLELQTGK